MTQYLRRLVDGARGDAQPAVRPRSRTPFEPDTPFSSRHAGGVAPVELVPTPRAAGPGQPASSSRASAPPPVTPGGSVADVAADVAPRRDPSAHALRRGAPAVEHSNDVLREPADDGVADGPSTRRLAERGPPGTTGTTGTTGTQAAYSPAPVASTEQAAPPAAAADAPPASARSSRSRARTPVEPAGLGGMQPSGAAHEAAADDGVERGDLYPQRVATPVRAQVVPTAGRPSRTPRPREDGVVETAPVVRITIGRIEVRAIREAPRQTVAPPRAAVAPRLGMDEYLRQRMRGER